MGTILLLLSVVGGAAVCAADFLCMKKFCNYRINNQIIITVLFISVIASFFSIIHSSFPTNAVKMIGLLAFLSSAAFISSKNRHMPEILFISAIVFRIIIAVIDAVLLKTQCAEILIRDILGGIFGSGIVILINKFSDNYFSKEEVKIFTVMGLLSGYVCTYSSMIIALIVLFVIKMYMLYRQNKTINIRLEPVLFCGYVVSMIIYKG